MKTSKLHVKTDVIERFSIIIVHRKITVKIYTSGGRFDSSHSRIAIALISSCESCVFQYS